MLADWYRPIPYGMSIIPNGPVRKPSEYRMELVAVGKRLRELREKHLGLDTLELATLLREMGVKGASNASVSRYESGKRTPPADYIWAMAHLTGVTTDWILAPAPSAAADPYRKGAEKAIVAMFERLLEIAESVGIEWPTVPAGGEEGQKARLAKRMRVAAQRRREHYREDLEHRRSGTDDDA